MPVSEPSAPRTIDDTRAEAAKLRAEHDGDAGAAPRPRERVADDWIRISEEFLVGGALDEAESAANEAARLSADADYPLGVGSAHLFLGQIAVRRNRFDVGERAYRDAIRIFRKTDNQLHLAFSL